MMTYRMMRITVINNDITKKVKQMIYIAVLCNPKITAEPLYNSPLFI